ncbi:MAG: hypothetical protein ACXWQQ_00315 [Pseudobdellovibrio sp.]
MNRKLTSLVLLLLFAVHAHAEFAGLPDGKIYPLETDLDHAEVITFDDQNIGTSLDSEAGYMAAGMDTNLKLANVSNPYLANLYQKNISLRSQSNAMLPISFQNLINFSFGYIKSVSPDDAAAKNGVPHEHLAFEIVKASFCFGTDPLMTLAKIHRETDFSRMAISSGGAVGFSQMTGAGIKEVQEQMSGDNSVSMPGTKEFFQNAIRCYTGNANYGQFTGDRVTVQKALRADYRLDLIYGQILLKDYVSYTSATNKRTMSETDSKSSYRDAFVLYNGDTHVIKGQCMGKKVQMRYEYSCDTIQFYNRLNLQWNNFIALIKKTDFT